MTTDKRTKNTRNWRDKGGRRTGRVRQASQIRVGEKDHRKGKWTRRNRWEENRENRKQRNGRVKKRGTQPRKWVRRRGGKESLINSELFLDPDPKLLVSDPDPGKNFKNGEIIKIVLLFCFNCTKNTVECSSKVKTDDCFFLLIDYKTFS